MSSRILFEVFQIWIDNQHWLEGNWEGFLSIEHYRVTVSWCYPGRGYKVSSPTILDWCSVLIVELKKFYYIFLLAYLIMFLTLIHGVIYNLSELFVLGIWRLHLISIKFWFVYLSLCVSASMVVFLTKSFSKYNKSIELAKFRLEICHRKFGHF
jgi:hypothetical protein